MKWFLKRFSEPSTWAGIAAVVFGGGAASGLDPAATPEFVSAIGAVIAGAIAILKRSPNEVEK